jgi:hypothetical protein
MVHPLIAENLTADDDPDLWDIAERTLFPGAEALAAETKQEVYAQVGCCHHWISPHHPLRWVADDTIFSWPFGYDKTTTGFSYRALPEFTWSVFLKWAGNAWEPGRTGKRCLVFRVTIPARTARHLRAAIHTIWTPRSPATKEKVVQVYGFRKREGVWTLTATETVPPRK